MSYALFVFVSLISLITSVYNLSQANVRIIDAPDNLVKPYAVVGLASSFVLVVSFLCLFWAGVLLLIGQSHLSVSLPFWEFVLFLFGTNFLVTVGLIAMNTKWSG